MPVPTKPPKFVRLKATTSMTRDDQESNRTFKELLPSPWTDQFHSIFVDVSVNTFEEFERELGPQGRSYNVSASKEVVIKLSSLLV
ncbi:hypothetical protein F2Q70_00032836 [Brassica cretica]|uniref:Uncharacterized protein n=1 Tax=Brassica cretica TaxID=69181 RepID=A0A8S9FMK1_BRACR|nr:hypothetical protein F2Q70_00032836 [Brassica cretica]